jgi:hypothetical protein
MVNKPVMLRVDHLPGDARGIVFTVTGAPPADPYGSVDFDYAPPCFYRVRAGCAEQRNEKRDISRRALEAEFRLLCAVAHEAIPSLVPVCSRRVAQGTGQALPTKSIPRPRQKV